MKAPRAVQTWLAALAGALAVTAVWLAFDNPEIHGTSRGDNYPCLAPWDTALNDASNFPGGEPPPDAEDIASRCSALGHARFDLAIASGATALALALVATTFAWRRPRAGVASPG